jgi:hypothetical protein
MVSRFALASPSYSAAAQISSLPFALRQHIGSEDDLPMMIKVKDMPARQSKNRQDSVEIET